MGVIYIRKLEIPVWEKLNLTIEEAAVLFNIGTKKLVELTNQEGCKFVFWNGNKRLIKKKQFEIFLDKVEVI